MSEADRRRRMRGVYRAVAYLAQEMQDTTIAQKLLKWEPWVRKEQPISAGIRRACEELDAYADSLEVEVKETILDISEQTARAAEA